MSFPAAFALIVAGLIVSARTRLNAVIFGQPVSIPWIGLIFAALILALVVLALCVARSILRDRPVPQYRSEPVHVITSLR